MEYSRFVESKEQKIKPCGIDVSDIDYGLYPFQVSLVDWSLNRGRCAIFADCGMGKTPMQLAWANEIHNHCNGNVLVLTPLAVAEQTHRESTKFSIPAEVSKDGKAYPITITNYEKLHHFDKNDFHAVVCDESSILKNYAGKTRDAITEFMSDIPYRLLCTATPAPNDFMELGTSSEALSIMRRVEMLAMYFTHNSGETQKWVIKGHAEEPFWKWMAQWSRAARCPADLGFDDNRFELPELIQHQITIKSKPLPGCLFSTEAVTLNDQRAERRQTIDERCRKVADIANSDESPFLAWCSLNDESKKMASLIKDSVELSGSDTNEQKERKMHGFSTGEIKCLITKPSIAGHGMNWQHCNRMSFFPSHSHEQYYQAVRRCWRYGQKKPVCIWIVTSDGESRVLDNMKRKEEQASVMFTELVRHMGCYYEMGNNSYSAQTKMRIPEWLSA